MNDSIHPVATAERIAIAGGPKTGKTTLASRYENPRHTDDVQALGWSESSDEVCRWFDSKGPLVIEGVIVCRALRKWLRRNRTGKPVDRVIYLNDVHRPLTLGQRNLAKGCRTVFNEIRDELVSRGVVICDNLRRDRSSPRPVKRWVHKGQLDL